MVAKYMVLLCLKILNKYMLMKTLGVKPSTNNCVICRDIGYALQIEVHIRMIKYWLKLTLSHSHQYINKLFCKPSEWLSDVQQLLCQNGLSYMWQSNAHVLITLYLYELSNNASKKIFNKSASQRSI